MLAPTCDAVLVGEHQNRPDLPPTLMAALIKERGVRPWITLTCRDRNRVVLEQELQGLAALGGVGVFCATGDGRAPGVRDEVTQVFDIDGTRLAGMAAHNGLPVGVPEAPDAPPRHLRPGRLLAKQEAGAQVVVLNHVGTVERLAAFVAEARAIGVRLPFVAGVAVYTDERSAAVLLRFPGLGLDAERVARRARRTGPGGGRVRGGGAGGPGRARGGRGRRGEPVRARNRAGRAGGRGDQGRDRRRDQAERSMTGAMEAEFDLVAEWTRQAVRELGDDYALPGGVPGERQPGRARLAGRRVRAERGHPAARRRRRHGRPRGLRG